MNAYDCYSIPFKNPKQYVKAKIRMLEHDFHIKPTVDEVVHLHSLKTEHEIDRAVHTIINAHWDRN